MERRIVYSTEHGRICPECAKPVSECICRKRDALPHGDAVVRVRMETKGRRGKGVTVISGLSLDPDDIRDLTKHLKQKCGAGGTAKGGVIEIQGDHRETVMGELARQGIVAKRQGG